MKIYCALSLRLSAALYLGLRATKRRFCIKVRAQPIQFLDFVMARLDILHYPDARLHTVAKPVKVVDARIRTLVDDMAETMYAAPGIGLAATQVDVHERVIVIDVSETRGRRRGGGGPGRI